MRDIDLFQLALGLVPPWMVAAVHHQSKMVHVDGEKGQKPRFPSW